MTIELPELPGGWCWCKLDDLLARIESGKSVLAQSRPATDGEYGVLKLSAVTWGEFDPSENKALLPSTSIEGMPSLKADDLLISRANTVELIGAVVLVKKDYPSLLLSDKTLRLVPLKDLIDSRFLVLALRTPWVRKIYGELATGTSNSMRNLSQDKIRSAPIPLPPLAEQRRIVERIEALQARSRKAREALAAVPPLLGQLRQSVLAAAFRGDLTAGWRQRHPDTEPASSLLQRIRDERRQRWEEAHPRKRYAEPGTVDEEGLPELPDGWCWTRAREVVDGSADIRYGIVQPGPPLDEGVPYVRGMDIQEGRIRVDQLWKTSPEIARQYQGSMLREGDVLLGIIRHLKVAVVPKELDGGNMARTTARLRPSRLVSTDYLAMALESPFCQHWLKANYRGGTSMPKVNIADVCRLPIPIAPQEEQVTVVTKVRAITQGVAVISDQVARALADHAHLEHSILAKAFRGELVPHDPSDEPASVLLKRLQAERLDKRGRTDRRG